LTLAPALRTVTGMLSRLALGAVLATALVFAPGEGAALADDPPKAPATSQAPPPAPPPAAATVVAPAPQASPRSAVVVATSDGAGPAARALAYDVYRDAELRPSAVDDPTARVLAGEVPGEGAPARVKEIAELRGSIVHAFHPAEAAPGAPAPSDLVARRLLASLGAELGATLVITVALDGTRPVARALRTATATFERVELGATVDIAADGARTFRWPGATVTLRGLFPGAAAVAPPAVVPIPAPLAPKAESAAAPPAPEAPRPFYKSPWFWGSVGGAAAVGLSVFLISRATSSTATNVHVTGTVGP
jgi:hypothetical protein